MDYQEKFEKEHHERPVEPNNASVEPELWSEVCQWEEDFNEFLQSQLKAVEGERDSLKSKITEIRGNWNSIRNDIDTDRFGYECVKTIDNLLTETEQKEE